jgi:alpha-glucosidase
VSPTSLAGAAARHREALWWHDAVIYHLWLPSFRDADGDGVGDLAGVVRGLDYLTELGVDAVWISPFFVSPMHDGGYDIADHCAIHPVFGSQEDFDVLLAAAHERSLKVLIDYVPNHTSDEHPWFMESRLSRESPKRDWYVWRDGRDGGPPNNWLSEAGGPTWTFDQATGQYYLHSHMSSQPDLNWRNPDVREAMLDVLSFWLERGVDGVRVDVAHMLMKDPLMRDNPLRPDGSPNPWDRQHPSFHTQYHVHDRRHPDLHGVLRDMRRVLDEHGERVAIGEVEVMPLVDWAEFYGAELDELHLPLNFALLETPWRAKDVRAELDALAAALPEDAWPIHNLGNHDRSRVASRYGRAQARIAAILLLTLRGTPLLYYGDELGMADVDVPPERRRDGFDLGDGAPTRDVNRTPAQWSAALHAGFSDGRDVEPWLPLAPDYREVNVERQREDPRSMLSLYRALVTLRRQRPALRRGSYRSLDSGADDVLVYTREHGDERLAIALNMGEQPARATLPSRARCLLSTHLDRHDETGPSVDLRPAEGVVLELI